MSISSEIERIQSAKADIITAIENKGVTVPTGAKIDELPELIGSIPSGGGGGGDILDILKNYYIGLSLDLTTNTYSESDYTIDLQTEFDNKQNLFCRYIAKTVSALNTFYSVLKGNGNAINLNYYRNSSGSNKVIPNIGAISQGTFNFSVFTSGVTCPDYQSCFVEFSNIEKNGTVYTSGVAGYNTTESNRSHSEYYTTQTFDKIILFGAPYNSSNVTHHGIFQQFAYWNRDNSKAVNLVPAVRKEDLKKGIIDLINGNFTELPDDVTIVY